MRYDECREKKEEEEEDEKTWKEDLLGHRDES
jgi:hypothetical protein